MSEMNQYFDIPTDRGVFVRLPGNDRMFLTVLPVVRTEEFCDTTKHHHNC